jgi:hypothetical protein
LVEVGCSGVVQRDQIVAAFESRLRAEERVEMQV